MQRYFEINEAKVNIRCKIYYNDLHNIKRVILFETGFGGHKDNKAAEKFAVRVLSKYKNVAMITFNWPCHGDDVKKKLSLEDCVLYLDLIVKYIREQYTKDEIYAYGTSFGGYTLLHYIAEKGNPFKKISLRCPAINMYGVITKGIIQRDEMSILEKGKDVPVGFDRKIMIGMSFLEELKSVDLFQYDYLDYADDIQIMHGTKDEVVPVEDSRKFAEENVIEFYTIENADHRFQNPQCMEEAMKLILEFYHF